MSLLLDSCSASSTPLAGGDSRGDFLRDQVPRKEGDREGHCSAGWGYDRGKWVGIRVLWGNVQARLS